MKRLALIFCVLASAAVARADVVQVDETFTKTQLWLSQQKLTVTGGPTVRNDGAAFTQDCILFYGESIGNPAHTIPAQREMLTKRAAEVDAKRRVVEYLEGFALVGSIDVKDGMLVSEVMTQRVAGFVKGVELVMSEYNREKDVAVALVKVGLHGPRGFASAFYESLGNDPKLQKKIASDKPEFKAEPSKLDQAYDGLIIDATDQNFRPALINRIFADKGEVLYDPAKVSQKVLVEQGCGEYTNTVDKAKAALETRGVKNPLVIKALSAPSPADLKISDDDAVNVFSANQKGNFFAAAKVAFVLR